jgi:hypothetical protein
MRISDTLVVSTAMPYTPPFSFLEELYRIDGGRLRVRWSEEGQAWVLERKYARASHNRPRGLPRYIYCPDGHGGAYLAERDKWIQMRDGYIHVTYWPPRALYSPDLVLRHLKFSDMARFRTPLDAARAIEAQEDQDAERKETSARDRIHNLTVDEYDHLQWKIGNRVAVPKRYADVSRDSRTTASGDSG